VRALKKTDITPELVARLVAAQFPQWAELPVVPVELDGWDNTTFRLGSTMSVRLPSGDAYVAQIDKEHRWLPRLAPELPVPIPEPLAQGVPGCGFPRPWSIYRWLDGEPTTEARVRDLTEFATDLGRFLAALYRCDTAGGPPAGAHSHSRGAPVSTWDVQTRRALDALESIVDVDAATAVWDAAIAAPSSGSPVWVHGDVTGSNLLVRGGRLCAVIDFGCSAVGDPACDTTIAWTFFAGESRARFMSLVPVDDGGWARGRGWALWKALLELVADQENPGYAAHAAERCGWRHSASQIVEEVIEDHRRTG
jgi:aminoglycoside phosphotransferase (APT) family kinase protein